MYTHTSKNYARAYMTLQWKPRYTSFDRFTCELASGAFVWSSQVLNKGFTYCINFFPGHVKAWANETRKRKNESEHTNITIPYQAGQNDAWLDYKKQSWEMRLSKYNNNSAPWTVFWNSACSDSYLRVRISFVNDYMTICVIEGVASPLAWFVGFHNCIFSPHVSNLSPI